MSIETQAIPEEEAGKRWCPFARAVPGKLDGTTMTYLGVPAHNRVHEEGEPDATWHKSHACIASECMAWRHELKEYTPNGGDPLATLKPKAPTGRGYCGLAGRP